ncbi:hypothetical protein JTE90_012295 [Oedothorax gibbosus]|uniref:Secreted protein n=1 Tax=Oedothorax gibbosus TaxID=931172 RepID=A0AAV6VIV4_9ARAC|nr:hypothetical protein JTE90_012295 [Oedothorax gibbosus]
MLFTVKPTLSVRNHAKVFLILAAMIHCLTDTTTTQPQRWMSTSGNNRELHHFEGEANFQRHPTLPSLPEGHIHLQAELLTRLWLPSYL